MSDQEKISSPEILEFLRSPVMDLHEVPSLKEKISVFIPLFLSEIVIAIFCGGIIGLLGHDFNSPENNKVVQMFNSLPLLLTVLTGVILSPFIEEFFFRLHLRLNQKYLYFHFSIVLSGVFILLLSLTKDNYIRFPVFAIALIIMVIYYLKRGKYNLILLRFWNQKYFSVFYMSAAIFGMMHITNYTPKLMTYMLMPILVLPQLILGLFCGYTRVRLGFLWGCLFHSLHNLVFIIPFLVSGS